MAVAVAVTRQYANPKGALNQGTLVVVGTMTFSGNYATGGDALDFITALAGSIKTDRQPTWVDIAGKAGFVYSYDFQNKKVFCYCNTAGGANTALGEVSAGAYPAGITGDTVVFRAEFPPLI